MNSWLRCVLRRRNLLRIPAALPASKRPVNGLLPPTLTPQNNANGPQQDFQVQTQ